MKTKSKIHIRFFVFAVVIIFVIGIVARINAKEDYKSGVVAANRNAGKLVALTFDDGPCQRYTGEILDILKEHDAKATFFVIGKNAEKYPELVKREADEGHEIGNHTYSHPDMKKIKPEDVVEEIEKTQDIIFEITGKKPVLFRSPGGYLDDEIVRIIKGYDCTPVLWSWRQDTKDWSKPSVNYIVNLVLDNLQDGDIILFHDFNTKGSPTPEALRILLPKLKERGYKFVTVSTLMGNLN